MNRKNDGGDTAGLSPARQIGRDTDYFARPPTLLCIYNQSHNKIANSFIILTWFRLKLLLAKLHY